jgi:hypothetical protein
MSRGWIIWLYFMSLGIKQGGFGVRWAKEFALITLVWLCPQISPAQGLGITITNGIANLSWPQTGFYYLLQSGTNLVPTNSWNNAGSASFVSGLVAGGAVPTLTNIAGGNIIFPQRMTNDQQFFRLQAPPEIPVFCFAIFYDQLLEFSGSANMVVEGLVHANGSIYTGSEESQTFNGPVTAVGTITSPSNAGYSSNDWSGAVFNGRPPFVTNILALISPVGTNNHHVLIEIPPAGEDPNSALGQARLYNQAEVVLIVTNSPLGGSPMVLLAMQSSSNGNVPGADPGKILCVLTNATPAFLLTNLTIDLPFLSLTNRFADQRENQVNMLVTQIDVGQYAAWIMTNSIVLGKFGNEPVPTLYVADQRNIGTSTLAVVRLVNGSMLPSNSGIGFTVATQNPLYVLGNYNITQNGVTFAYTIGSTTNGVTVPAALFADAITILSPEWADSLSADSYGARPAVRVDVTINAAFATGNVPSTGITTTTFSGGEQNLLRYLEDWSSSVLTMNTSLACLFSSELATNQFQFPGIYFNSPTRNWQFDFNFFNLSKLPPSTPVYTLP